ncbi:hypothetical protein E2C01_075969 [Portunus trituberculatus]|uniref:Uncharacterized protein n=1 Tax=Portunus trituberculatus TaxID=210409 RepID=A0A5B7IIH2_PORTR|nr:hypothetical protein [Portunus trituberculatus]
MAEGFVLTKEDRMLWWLLEYISWSLASSIRPPSFSIFLDYYEPCLRQCGWMRRELLQQTVSWITDIV